MPSSEISADRTRTSFCIFMGTAYPATGPTSNGGSLLCGLGRALPEGEHIWLVSFMDCDLGYFDHETCRGIPRQPLRTNSVTRVPKINRNPCVRYGPLRDGAPRSMKMGTTRSPWRYDAAIRHALQSANLRRPAICTTPHRRLCPRFRRVVRLPFDSGPVAQSRDRRDVPNGSLRTARKNSNLSREM